MGTVITNTTTTGGRLDLGGGAVWSNNLVFYWDAGNNFGGPQSGDSSTTINNIAPKGYANRHRQTGGLENQAQIQNGAFLFDGVGDRIDMEDTFTMDSAGATLMWWMAPHSATTSYNIVGQSNGGGVVKLIEFRQTFFYGETNNNCGYFNSPSFEEWVDGEWHHVAVRFNSSQEAHWFIDGENIGETSDYGYVNCDTNNLLSNLGGYDLSMRWWGSGGYSADYKGQLNQMMFYDTELSDGIIAQNYRAQRYRYS